MNKEDKQAATKKDIERLRSDLLNEMNGQDRRFDQKFSQNDKRFKKIDLRFEQVDKRFEQVDKRFEQVIELIKSEGQEIRDHMEALIEEVREDVGGANKDEIDLIKNQKLPDHEKRIINLEKRVGVL